MLHVTIVTKQHTSCFIFSVLCGWAQIWEFRRTKCKIFHAWIVVTKFQNREKCLTRQMSTFFSAAFTLIWIYKLRRLGQSIMKMLNAPTPVKLTESFSFLRISLAKWLKLMFNSRAWQQFSKVKISQIHLQETQGLKKKLLLSIPIGAVAMQRLQRIQIRRQTTLCTLSHSCSPFSLGFLLCCKS